MRRPGEGLGSATFADKGELEGSKMAENLCTPFMDGPLVSAYAEFVYKILFRCAPLVKRSVCMQNIFARGIVVESWTKFCIILKKYCLNRQGNSSKPC